MNGTLERVSVVVTEVVRPIPAVSLFIAYMTLADLVQHWLAQHCVIAHVVHRSRLRACTIIR